MEKDIRQVIVMRIKYPDGNGGFKKLRTGKLIAQGCHASLSFLTRKLENTIVPSSYYAGDRDAKYYGTHLDEEEIAWIAGCFKKICVYVNTEEELKEVAQKATESNLRVSLITDSGLTEFNGVPTLTCCAIGPHSKDKFEGITDHLPLL
jgi:PTH2 family peptidyl-tRNA hydrolase